MNCPLCGRPITEQERLLPFVHFGEEWFLYDRDRKPQPVCMDCTVEVRDAFRPNE